MANINLWDYPGEPIYVETIYNHLIDVKEDGSFGLNQGILITQQV